TEQVEEPKPRDVEDFKKAVQARFPAKSSMIRGEDFVEEDTTNFKQGEQEDLPTYYGRALNLLRRSNTRDTPPVGSPPLSAAERILLQMTIKAYVRGLREKELRKIMLTRPRPTSLLDAFETIQQVTEGMKQVEAAEKEEFERMEMDILRRSYVEEHGRPLRSVLAEVYKSSKKDPFDQQLTEMAKIITPRPQQ
ncbi:hypothetical protein K3495_g17177, partial [Podosphaera aphanis]